jgi:hypothetical protein
MRQSAHVKATSSMGRASILLAVSRILRDTSSSRSRGHLAHIFNPGGAMRPRGADLSPQALMRARCPRSLKTRAGRPCPPFEKAASSITTQSTDLWECICRVSGNFSKPRSGLGMAGAKQRHKGPCLGRNDYFILLQRPLTVDLF